MQMKPVSSASGRKRKFVTVGEIFHLSNMLCWRDRLPSARSRPSMSNECALSPSDCPNFKDFMK